MKKTILLLLMMTLLSYTVFAVSDDNIYNNLLTFTENRGIIIGPDANITSGTANIAIGEWASVASTNSIAIGRSAKSRNELGVGSTVLGSLSTTNCFDCTSIGTKVLNSGNGSTLIGTSVVNLNINDAVILASRQTNTPGARAKQSVIATAKYGTYIGGWEAYADPWQFNVPSGYAMTANDTYARGRLEVGSSLYVNKFVTIKTLKDNGDGFVCVNSNGELYRSQNECKSVSKSLSVDQKTEINSLKQLASTLKNEINTLKSEKEKQNICLNKAQDFIDFKKCSDNLPQEAIV